MKIEKVKITQVKVNGENPRTITTDKFQKLVNSILVLPKMLEIRPIVVDDKMQALGGNMRLMALKEIAKMNETAIENRLSIVADYKQKTQGEQSALLKQWKEWLKTPTTYIINASELSEDERKQFLIKDNVSFGTWDYDALANKWDNSKLSDWGMDVWNAPQPSFFEGGSQSSSGTSVPQSVPDPSEEDGKGGGFLGALPDELQGIDLTPNPLPKIEGDDQTAMERIIICYKVEDKQKLCNLLGMPEINGVVFRLSDILGEDPKN